MPAVAAYIGFIAAILAMIFNYGLIVARQHIFDTHETVTNLTLFLIMFLLAIRHQFRIIFMDDILGNSRLSIGQWKFQLRLLFLIAIMSGVSLVVSRFGNNVVVPFMMVYSILFVIFGVSVFFKSSPKYLRKQKNLRAEVGLSLVVDTFTFGIWFFSGLVIYGVLPIAGVGKGISFSLLFFGILIATEFLIVFRGAVCARFVTVFRHIF